MQNITFCQEIEYFSKSFIMKMNIDNKSKNTILAYNTTYKHFIAFCKQYHKELTFKNIKQIDIYSFLEYKSETMEKQGNISTSTKNSIIAHLKALFRHIERNIDELYDFSHVFEEIKSKRTIRIPHGLSDNEVIKLLNEIERMKTIETFTNFRNALLIKFCLFGAMRASEAVSIRLKDIVFDPENKLYKISFVGKGDKQGDTYIQADDIEDEIEMLKDTFKINNDVLIAHTKSGKRMDRVQLWKMIASVFKKAGIDKTGVHVLRHTAAKRLVSSGVPITIVQKILRHASLETTSIYVAPSEDIIKRELNRVEKIKNDKKIPSVTEII